MARPSHPRPDGPLSPQPEPALQSRRNQLILAGVLLGILLVVPFLSPSGDAGVEERELSDVLAAVERGSLGGKDVTRAVLDDDNRVVVLSLAGGTKVSASYPDLFGSELVGRLETAELPFKTEAIERPSPFGAIAATLLPVGLIIGFFVYMARKGGLGGAGGAKAFTTTKAELPDAPISRFADVVGCDEAVEELSEVVSFLHDADRFEAAGARMPRGFLLVGPPGTGKTLLARAVAGEAGVPFYSAAGSDFAEMFVGVGAARVRDLFAKAKKTGGIVFVDELDSVGRARNGNTPGGGGASEERESTLNALLVEMDGFGKQDNVVVIAATNRPDVLDPALLRAGRFDRQVTVAPPDRRGRTRLLGLYAQDRRMHPDVDFVALARRTPGLTGADIANLVNQAALEAARDRREVICSADFDEALATVIMGRARRSAVVTDRDREVTAWHEAGHTVAALVLPDAHDPVQVTIVPRGVAGGVTWMGGDDHSFLTRSQARARLAVALSGRAAEEMLLDGDFTQGASGDLSSATSLAVNMVTQWGMSSLGLSALNPEWMGAALAEKVMGEVDSMLADALDSARSLLAENRALFDAVVKELLEEETVELDRLKALWEQVKQPQESAA
ncbi:MAG TPA: AAA family ATPase [Acidimicrobiia bacterium]|nr:AAA family ATPase [Acidimicrobiia bacterium]